MRRNGQTGFRWRIDIRNFRWSRHVSNTRLSQGCSSSFDSNGTGFGCWICVYRISSAFLGKGSQHRRMLIPQFPSLSPGSLRHSSWWSTWSDSLDLHGPRLKWRGIPSLYTRHTVHTFNWSSLARIRWHLSLLRCHPSDKLLLSAVTVQQTGDSRAVCTGRSFCLLLSVDAPRMDEDGRMMHTISSCECCLWGISDGVSEVTQETFLRLVSKFGDGLFLSSCHPRHVITFEELSCRFNNFSRKCSRPSCGSGCALIFSWVNPTACLRRRWKRYFLTIPPTMDRDISRFVWSALDISEPRTLLVRTTAIQVITTTTLTNHRVSFQMLLVPNACQSNLLVPNACQSNWATRLVDGQYQKEAQLVARAGTQRSMGGNH